MNKFFVFIITFVLLLVLTGCNYNKEEKLNLIKVESEIIQDKEKNGSTILTAGKNKGKELIPHSLHYYFTLENVGKTIKHDIENDFNIRIVPNKDLSVLTKRLFEFDIFNPSENTDTGMGYGNSFEQIESKKHKTHINLIRKGEKFIATIHYDLGYDLKTDETPYLVPSQDDRNKLINLSMNSTLIIIHKNKEIARLDLSSYKNKSN